MGGSRKSLEGMARTTDGLLRSVVKLGLALQRLKLELDWVAEKSDLIFRGG